MILHLLVYAVIYSIFPDAMLVWAPTILLGILILAMAVGALKLLVGLFLSTVNPLIAFFYTFFFANAVGKQISKAVLTTALIAGIVYFLNWLNIHLIYIAAAALTAYIPFVILLLVVWYVVCRIFEIK